MFDLDREQAKPADTEWTGAEVRSCCRLAALLDVPLVEAARNVVPVARTAQESVERLRTWACGRCLREHSDGSWTYAADKDWCGGDVCEAAAGLLSRYGLVPEAEIDGEPMEEAATQPGNRAFLQAVGQLLESPELKLDEMEQTTREAIARVRRLLHQHA